ncbi:MAG: endonuclease/exonuclease/phosphatase family protein [Acidobacteria bacterium]|nr:endonuclease/exonuclease/phosphatase family protein [Acidobacteriota bacterium]
MRRGLTASLVLTAVVLAAVCRHDGGHAAPRGRVRLKVMSYNIHVGIGMDKKLDLGRIADVIRRSGCDLVGLQEVDRGVERTGRVDEIKELARLTGMDYAFAHNLDYQGGQYGVAVLSRYPILAIDHRRYANTRERERRGFIRVEVEVKGRRLNFVTTHLDYQYADGRLFETRQLLDALKDVRGPLIVTGDFNEEPRGQVYELMRAAGFADGWRRAGEGATYPADKPAKRIDYVFYRGLGEGRTPRDDEDAAQSVPDTLASDHRPVVVGLWF